MPTEAFITGDLLRWARERADVSPDALAKSLHVSTDEIAEWENGESRPSFRKAQDAAHRLKIPFGYLFLSKRPADRLELPDLRAPTNGELASPSVDLLDVVEETIRKQAWLRDYLLEQGSEPLAFVGRFGLDAAAVDVATDIRNELGMTREFRREASSWENFLTRLVRRIEDTGIVVFRSGIVGGNTHRPLDPEEFKGFVISDRVAPAIFVNTKDWKASQIFTLGHELAHIWLGASGVSDPDITRPAHDYESSVERLCDQVAAEVLVPAEDFTRDWGSSTRLAANIEALATSYRVSQIVVLRRASELGVISTEQFYQDYTRQLRERQSREEKITDDEDEVKKPTGNFYTSFFARNSTTFMAVLFDAVAGGLSTSSEAASLAGVKRTTIEKLMARGPEARSG